MTRSCIHSEPMLPSSSEILARLKRVLDCEGPDALQAELHRLIGRDDDPSLHQHPEQEIARLNRVLQQRVADLQTILDTVPIGLAIAEDPQGRRIRGNPVNERMLGLPPGSELSRGAPEPAGYRVFQNGTELNLESLPMQRAIRGETVTGQLIEVERPDGQRLFLHCNAAPLPGEDGRPRGAVGAFLDITQLKETETALQSSEARLRLLSDTSARLLVADDPQALIEDLCRAVMTHLDCQVFFNYLADEATERLRLNAWAGIPEQDAAELAWLDYGGAVCGIVARERRRIVAEDLRDQTDPRTRLVASFGVQAYCCHPLLVGERLLGTLSFGTRTRGRFAPDDVELMQAVTNKVAIALQRVQVQTALRASEERYRGLVEQAADGIFVSDAQGRYLDVNTIGASMLGYTRDALLTLRIADVVIAEEVPSVPLEIARLADGEVIRSQWQFRRKDGSTFPGEVLARRLPNGRLQGILRDITERTRNEARLAEQARQLREADRAKDEFLAMLAHELRNPLSPIVNAVQILKSTRLSDAQLTWCRDLIERQAGHLTRLVDDLLDISRIARDMVQIQQGPVDLAEIVQRAVETSRPLIDSRGHQLSIHLPPETVRVTGDSARLAQVVANLLNNAAKYTDEGGQLRLLVECDGTTATIRVQDNGRGIDPAVVPHVFDLFFQAERTIDRAEGGLGIGLSLVKRLVDLHGGTVHAVSGGRGQGSEFVVRLPRCPGAPGVPAPPSVRGAAAPAEDLVRLLIVDDNRDAADSLALLLGSDGYQVMVAYDGEMALGQVPAFRPQVVLLDLGLPGLDGYEVAELIRGHAELPPIRLIALTGHSQPEDRKRSKAAGFDAHLIKPVDPGTLRGLLAGLRATTDRGAGAERTDPAQSSRPPAPSPPVQPHRPGAATPPGGASGPAGAEALIVSLIHELSQPLAAVAMYSSAAAHLVRSGKVQAGELGDVLGRIETQVKRAMEMLTQARQGQPGRDRTLGNSPDVPNSPDA